MPVNLDASETRELTERQSAVLALVTAYCAFHRVSGCPASFVANRMGIHYSTVREHFAALYRKGWLASESCTAAPARSFLSRNR